MVTEPATDAGSYAPGPYGLRTLHDNDLPIRAEVADAGGGVPLIERLSHRPFTAPGRVDDLELGGRGLRIVDEFTAGRRGPRWTHPGHRFHALAPHPVPPPPRWRGIN